MPLERRIRQGTERNAGVLDPDVDRFLGAVVHKARRRIMIRRSLAVVASTALVAFAIVAGPSVLDDIGGSDGVAPGGTPTSSVTPPAPFLTGTFIRTIPTGTAVVRANGIAGTWTIRAEADGRVRVLAPALFAGATTSHPFEMQTDRLSTDAFAAGLCSGDPAGTYAWSLQDGSLVLTVLSDPCDARVAVLGAGPWQLGS